MWHRFQLNGDAVHDLDSMHSATHKRGSSMRSGPRTSESRRILCRTRKPCGIEFQLRLCLFFWAFCVFFFNETVYWLDSGRTGAVGPVTL